MAPPKALWVELVDETIAITRHLDRAGIDYDNCVDLIHCWCGSRWFRHLNGAKNLVQYKIHIAKRLCGIKCKRTMPKGGLDDEKWDLGCEGSWVGEWEGRGGMSGFKKYWVKMTGEQTFFYGDFNADLNRIM